MADVLLATCAILGLRYSDEVAHALFEEVLGMEESATYQAIFRRARDEGREEGRAEEALRLLLLLGESKFGPPDAGTRAALERIDDLARLEALAMRLRSAGSWQELLAPQAPPRRRGRRRTGGRAVIMGAGEDRRACSKYGPRCPGVPSLWLRSAQVARPVPGGRRS